MRRVALSLALFAVVAPAQAQAPVAADHAERMARGLELFDSRVGPLLKEHCLRCHGGKRTESEFDLSDRAGALKGGLMGVAVVPGEHKKSPLWQMAAHVKEPVMPEDGERLPQADLDALAKWIDLGAPYGESLLSKAQATAWTKKVTPAKAKQHWAYRPLAKPQPPAVGDAEWAGNPVDRFLKAKLDASKVAPNGPADRATVLRRLSFALTGLPPTPEALAALRADKAGDADALARAADALLATPAYGERWGRHWLDLARWGESHGFEHDYDRPNAYHYRDAVIEAFNRDLPFDTFARWQLAGDELAPRDPLALKLTGFLAAGVHSTQITANEVEKHRYDELDDMLATTGTAMLGLTFGCARCHDHKYDAIPQRDYYRMLSTFTTTVRADVDVDGDPEGYKRRKEAFDREHAPIAGAVAKYERETLPAKLAAWEKAGGAATGPWRVLEVADAKSGGATLTRLPDGVVVTSGKLPPIETFTFTLKTDGGLVRALRLETLADPALAAGGPGRAANGNFCLTHLAATLHTPGQPPRELTFAAARATFDQKGLPASAAIDGDPVQSGWAVDPQFGRDHAAAFALAEPVTPPAGAAIVVRMHFHNNVGHHPGRTRLSVTADPPAALELLGGAVPLALKRALATPAERRNAAERELATRWFAPRDPEWARLDAARAAHAATAPRPSVQKVLVSSEGVEAVRLHTQGGDFLPETHFLKRGDVAHKEGVAEPSFLQALMPDENAASLWAASPPAGSKLSYRRAAFAGWLTDTERGAGSLLARVIVNRLWQHHFGRGLVATPSDFGVRGEPASHPELLDYLANELIKGGWRLKPIHRLIASSRAYRSASASDEARLTVDRPNALLWRFAPRRLEAEAIRDALLAVSGRLDATVGGPGTLDENSRRRSVYFTVKRSRLIGAMVVFDAPDGSVGVGERAATTIAPQALHLMNSPQARDAARALAARFGSDPVTDAYRLALGRDPSAEERADGEAFVRGQQASYQSAGRADAAALARADFAQVVLCLNEFVFVE